MSPSSSDQLQNDILWCQRYLWRYLNYRKTGLTNYCTIPKYQNADVVQLITENRQNWHKKFFFFIFRLQKLPACFMWVRIIQAEIRWITLFHHKKYLLFYVPMKIIWCKVSTNGCKAITFRSILDTNSIWKWRWTISSRRSHHVREQTNFGEIWILIIYDPWLLPENRKPIPKCSSGKKLLKSVTLQILNFIP